MSQIFAEESAHRHNQLRSLGHQPGAAARAARSLASRDQAPRTAIDRRRWAFPGPCGTAEEVPLGDPKALQPSALGKASRQVRTRPEARKDKKS